jgi:hypothetical protein
LLILTSELFELMKKTILSLAILAFISSQGFSTPVGPQVQVSGGGDTGSPVEITLLSDITLHVTPGNSIGGYYFGFVIPGAFLNSDGYNNAAVSSTSGFTYQTDPNTSAVTSNIAWTRSSGSDLYAYFQTTSNWADELITEGGSITFKAGTISGLNYFSHNILSNPGATYTLTLSSFFTETESYSSYSPSSVSFNAVPEPSTYALFGLGALGLVIACRRRAA